MPKVSIIIPCYNDGKYLKEAVDSALAQTYKNIEIIIINDNSTDQYTQKVLQQLVSNLVCILQNPSGKKGPAAARNTGIMHATGKYILPLDADDKIDPTYVAKAVNVLETNPSIGICYCKAHFFGLKRGPWELPPYSFAEMLAGNIIFVTALFHKSTWEQVCGYDERLILGLEDYAFWLKIIDLGYEVVQLQEVLFYYRTKQNSLIANLSKDNNAQKALKGVYDSCEHIFKKNTFILLQHIHSLKDEQSRTKRLISWKFLQHFFKLEWFLRQCVKRLVGRA